MGRGLGGGVDEFPVRFVLSRERFFRWLVASCLTWVTVFARRLPRWDERCVSHRRRPRRFLGGTTTTKTTPTTRICARLTETKNLDTEGRADDDMDPNHLRISLGAFLWSCYCIAPSAIALQVWWAMKFCVKSALRTRGWLKVIPPDPRRADLLLKSVTLPLAFRRVDVNQGREVAIFVFDDFPIVDENCDMCISDSFEIHVDLQERLVVHATLRRPRKFDEQPDDDDDNSADDTAAVTTLLSPQDTLCLLAWAQSTVYHPLMHALANWACNVDAADPELRRNSISTAVYNYYGFVKTEDVVRFWTRLGIVNVKKPNEILRVLRFSVRNSAEIKLEYLSSATSFFIF